MTKDELLAWQARVVGDGYGAQVKAAALLNTPPQTYRNWITGRFEILGPVERLTQYVERFGPFPTGDTMTDKVRAALDAYAAASGERGDDQYLIWDMAWSLMDHCEKHGMDFGAIVEEARSERERVVVKAAMPKMESQDD